MKYDYREPRMRLVDFVFDIGRLDMEGEPDNFTWVYVLDLYRADRSKGPSINKRFFGGTATITEWPDFNMVRLTCRSEKGLDRHQRLFEKFLDAGERGKDWLPGGAARIAWEGGTAETTK